MDEQQDNSEQHTMTGAEIVVKCLENEGVSTVFAYPGAASMELHHVLKTSKIRVVLPRHEQGAAFAAGGYARISGKAGVCIATSGPGATNLVTGIADAWMDSIPLVAITANVNHHLIGKNAFQETDIIGMTIPIVKHSILVLTPDELPEVIKDAFALATTGRPGPVVIDIPCDVLPLPCNPVFPDKPSLRAFSFTPDLLDGDLDMLRRAIAKSSRPCIFAGGGVIHSNASGELLRFAETWNIPVATSLMGIGAFPENHPLSLKWLGMHGTFYANKAVHECDLLISLGVRFSDRVTGNIDAFAPHAKIVHVDIDPSEINKNKHADMPVVSDIRLLLQRMLTLKPPLKDRTQWLAQVNEWKNAHPLVCPETIGMEPRGQAIVRTIDALTHGQATIVTGVGQNQMWAAQFYTFTRPRQLLTSGGLGAMGFGLPAAIGAKLANPASQVILIDGDGSFQMNIQELATAYAENVPVKIVILNNQMLGMVAQWEDKFYGGHRGNTDMTVPAAKRPYPDFCTIAKGYMIPARDVWTKDDIVPAIREMLEAKGPFLLDVHTRSHDQVLPMIPAGKTCDDIIL